MLSRHIFSTIPIVLNFIPAVLSQTYYTQNAHFKGKNFLDAFNWETFDDPTHGRVNFIDQQTALNTNLSYADDDVFIMRADYHQIVPSYARGRDSVRITSHDAWGDSLLVLDLAHMPEGCATWPAYWTVSKNGPWPQGGEMDIIEGVNLNNNNLASLHTMTNCTMPQTRSQTGQVVSTNCDAAVNYNQGCGVAFATPASYGSGFNTNGGGWVATWRSPNSISHWFWPRNAPNVPDEIRQGDSDVVTPGENWGTPDATFVWPQCDYNSHFDPHQIIFDLTLCGDWAGNAFPTAGCGPGNCQDFVDNNPDAFGNAFWEINSLTVYTPSSF
ncbi:glycoside hydrolase family 16 protein [Lentinula raphanica]|uniref:Glycoside hydrolase family 16 protein n=1 Tax=Lentinula raphanica TaxID=153919 RepID=A0AA38PK70_9AGAR|nr:glycoside hydrolase family 16 protein [Lentinula raphanica]KAJ3975754.1 glycoside hydrolase family 16 protein [Lentinula raphanica]